MMQTRLKELSNGVALVLVGEKGDEQTLVTVTTYGVRREHDLPDYLGLPLDADGRLRLDET